MKPYYNKEPLFIFRFHYHTSIFSIWNARYIMKKQLVLRERVYRFYNANKEEGKMFTINHFSAENEHPRTIRRIIDRIESRIPMIHQRKYAQSTLKMNKAKLSKLEELFDHSKGISRLQSSKFHLLLSINY